MEQGTVARGARVGGKISQAVSTPSNLFYETGRGTSIGACSVQAAGGVQKKYLTQLHQAPGSTHLP